jgi:nicotinate-nucleotide--dimethylbenzimidazole phosphoribosyltransferase
MSIAISTFAEALESIVPLDAALLENAQKRLDSLTKPRGSLGLLEEFAKRVVAITEDTTPRIDRKIIFIFAADHGVAEEGVSAYPKEVTRQMVFNFLKGGAGINVLARHVEADVAVVDIGVDFDFDDANGLIKRKVVKGSRNMRKGPAMSRDETIKCMEMGVNIAHEYAMRGFIFGTGEMGIANTTPASAVAAVLTGSAPAEVTGRGTGIDEGALRNKISVIEDALKKNSPDPNDPVDVLSKVGGPEIAGIAGFIIGAASVRVPVVIDGFISTAGALAAVKLNPLIKDYLFASHNSVELGHRVMLDHMGIKPCLELGMRLGEGTGAALAISLIESGVKVYNEMATFDEAGVSGESSKEE